MALIPNPDKNYILAIDEGTSSTRAVVYNHQLEVISIAQVEINMLYPEPDAVEQNGTEIWQKTWNMCCKALDSAGLKWKNISCIGITNQRETTLIWDKKSGKPIHNAIIWQSKQSNNICSEWINQNLSNNVKRLTGLPINPYFSASKIAWILEKYDPNRVYSKSGDWLFGTVDTWLCWNLSGHKSHVTDSSNASRTLLFDIRKVKWSKELCTSFNIPEQLLPEIVNTSGLACYTNPELTDGETIPILSIVGDQQSALYAQQCFEKGEVKNTYGTGCFMLMNTGTKVIAPKFGILSTIAWTIENRTTYALEGSVMVGGSAIKWLRDGLHAFDTSSKAEKLALESDSSDELFVIPTFYGLGTPFWDNKVKGSILGLKSDTKLSDITYSTLQSIAFQCEDVMQSMQKASKIDIKSLKVDGGATKNKLLMQMQADVSDTRISVSADSESTVRGAALLAALALGLQSNSSLIAETYSPQSDKISIQNKYQRWKRLIAQIRKIYN